MQKGNIIRKDSFEHSASTLIMRYGGLRPPNTNAEGRKLFKSIDKHNGRIDPLQGVMRLKRRVFDAHLKKYDVQYAFIKGYVNEKFDFQKKCWVTNHAKPKQLYKPQPLLRAWVCLTKERQAKRKAAGLEPNIIVLSKELEAVHEVNTTIAQQNAYVSIVNQIRQLGSEDLQQINYIFVYNLYNKKTKQKYAWINKYNFQVNPEPGEFDIDWKAYEKSIADALKFSGREMRKIEPMPPITHTTARGKRQNPNQFRVWVGLTWDAQLHRKKRGKPENITFYSKELDEIGISTDLNQAKLLAYKTIREQFRLIKSIYVVSTHIYHNYDLQNHQKGQLVYGWIKYKKTPVSIRKNHQPNMEIDWEAYQEELRRASR
ncbi:MAG: hypothetical protein AAF806_18880 [Bacteroidota bacterium]